MNNSIFVNEIFSLCFPEDSFVGGSFVDRIAYFMENKYTMRVSARDHFKSTSFYAHFLRMSMQNAHRNLEGHYFSFKEKMAGYHIAKIKQMKNLNPLFDKCIDKKKNAEAVIKYTWDGKHYHTLVPHGLLAFKRGIHCDLLYVDDPFQDPANKLVTTIIDKINKIVKTEILDMVKKGGQLHIAGTPQTENDFFFDQAFQDSFATLILPAIVNDKTREVLWKEWMNWDDLMKKKELRGDKIFNQEYLCSPVYTEEAFFTKDQIDDIISNRQPLNARVRYETQNEVIAGFDIGKKAHPSHLAVFELVDGKLKEIYQRWWDRIDYTVQIDDLTAIVDNLKIDRLFYDATRGELESLSEQGLLPECMIPVNFSSKTKNSMATEFEKAVIQKKMELLPDQRQRDQILLVDNELNAITTPQGHGDSFWSIALALADCLEAQPNLEIL